MGFNSGFKGLSRAEKESLENISNHVGRSKTSVQTIQYRNTSVNEKSGTF